MYVLSLISIHVTYSICKCITYAVHYYGEDNRFISNPRSTKQLRYT